MKHRTLTGWLVLLVLGLAACGPSPTPPTTPVSTEPLIAPTYTPVSTETAVPSATSAPTETSTPANVGVTPKTTVMPGEARLKMGEMPDMSASYLTNTDGMAVYISTNDSQNSGTSTCTGNCASNWPPVTTVGKPMAGQGVDVSLLGTLTRPDGSVQVTYNGWPLYTFSQDATPFDTKGQGIHNSWYLISVGGDPVKK